jgi:hypothetical protein
MLGRLPVLSGSYVASEGVLARARRRLEALSLRPGAARVRCRVRRAGHAGLAAAAIGCYRQGLADFPPRDSSPRVALEI